MTLKKKTTSKKTATKKIASKKEVILPHQKKIDDGSLIDIRTPLWEVPKQPELRYDVSWTQEKILVEKESIKDKLTPKQEMFCQYYCCNEETRFNATWSYAYAYWYDLEGADTEVIRDKLTWEVIKKSERLRLEGICAACSNAMLRNSKIQARFTELFNELKKDHIVDREMMKLILQNDDNKAKQDMIKEYNKLMKRITDKIEHSWSLTLADGLINLARAPQKPEV